MTQYIADSHAFGVLGVTESLFIVVE